MKIEADCIDDAYLYALNLWRPAVFAKDNGRELKNAKLRLDKSQRGDVYSATEPLTTILNKPLNNVLLDETRDANPFFHLAEFFWILRGDNSSAPLNVYISDFGERYAEPDGKIWGAYGYRLRYQFNFDQIIEVIELLRREPNTRRAVLEIWDATADLNDDEKRDRPCNTHCYFRIQDGGLSMTVCSRSHDVIWGLLGANTVHFSLLLDVIAQLSGCFTDKLIFFSNNPHIYKDVLFSKINMRQPRNSFVLNNKAPSTYFGDVWVSPGGNMNTVRDKLKGLREHHISNIRWVTEDVYPLLTAHKVFKDGDNKGALLIAKNVWEKTKFNPAWPFACYNWLGRKIAKRIVKENNEFDVFVKDLLIPPK